MDPPILIRFRSQSLIQTKGANYCLQLHILWGSICGIKSATELEELSVAKFSTFPFQIFLSQMSCWQSSIPPQAHKGKTNEKVCQKERNIEKTAKMKDKKLLHLCPCSQNGNTNTNTSPPSVQLSLLSFLLETNTKPSSSHLSLCCNFWNWNGNCYDTLIGSCLLDVNLIQFTDLHGRPLFDLFVLLVLPP